jgi:predicted component of type VI protein secretion system
MATLRLVPVSGPPIDVVKDQSMVGREPSCEIVVSDGSVSRRHARLEKRGETWWVVDQGSANGTYVNSLKVAEQALKNNQELRFGALAFRVDLREDPEATVSAPRPDDSATVMAAPIPPPVPPAPVAPPPAAPAPKPAGPPPLPHAAATAPPHTPPSAAAARERARPSAPVPQMPAGAPPAKKGRSPIFWIAIGCCGCLLLVGLLAAVIGGGAYMSTKGAADAAHAWLGEVRHGQSPDAGMTEAYRSRLTPDELQTITTAIAQSKDATFISRSVDNDRATLRGVLTGGGSPRPVTIKLLKEGGTWKVDEVTLGVE